LPAGLIPAVLEPKSLKLDTWEYFIIIIIIIIIIMHKNSINTYQHLNTQNKHIMAVKSHINNILGLPNASEVIARSDYV